MNEDDYSDKYMRGAPWRSAAQARLATVLAAADGPAGDAAEG